MNCPHLCIMNMPICLFPMSDGAICMVVVNQPTSVLEKKMTWKLNTQPFFVSCRCTSISALDYCILQTSLAFKQLFSGRIECTLLRRRCGGMNLSLVS